MAIKGRNTRAPRRASSTLASACIGEVKGAPSIQTGEWNKLYRWATREARVNSSAQRLVLVTLVSYVNSSLTCFPSIRELEGITCYGRTTILKTLKELESLGMIKRIRRGRRGERGGRTTDYYRVQPEGMKVQNSDFESNPDGIKVLNSDFESKTIDEHDKQSVSKSTDNDSSDSKPKIRTRIFDHKTRAREAQRDRTCPKCGRKVKVEQTKAGEYRYCLPDCGYSITIGSH